jgi:hypothetical protein
MFDHRQYFAPPQNARLGKKVKTCNHFFQIGFFLEAHDYVD